MTIKYPSLGSPNVLLIRLDRLPFMPFMHLTSTYCAINLGITFRFPRFQAQAQSRGAHHSEEDLIGGEPGDVDGTKEETCTLLAPSHDPSPSGTYQRRQCTTLWQGRCSAINTRICVINSNKEKGTGQGD